MNLVRTACGLAIMWSLLAGPTLANDAYVAKLVSKLDSYFTWSSEKKFEGGDKSIVISAVGKSDLIGNLKKLNSTNSSTGKTIKVRVVEADMIPSNSHVVVLALTDTTMIKKVSGLLKGTGSLILTSGEGYTKLGVTLNVFDDSSSEDSKSIIELNSESAKAQGLTVNPAFLKIARIIE